MYTTCMFCTKELGRNESVEHFPVGNRLAFDASRGRLWVVCRKCERWNLTPIEERWEAVEECEILFERTRVRAQTENVGLARLPDGTTLVRIGDPMRREFAAWRYGDQFGRRRKKAFLIGGAVAVGIGAVAWGGLAAGVISGTFLGQSGNFVNAWINGRTLAKVKSPEGKVVALKRPDLMASRLVRTEDDQGWALEVRKGKKEHLIFEGPEAREVAGRLMARLNSSGGKSSDVQDAVTRIEEAGHPDEFLRISGKDAPSESWKAAQKDGLGKLKAPDRLALEMALHEEAERRALQGELWALEQRWKDAEEIAAIADGLLLPESADEFLAEHGEPSTDRELSA